MDIDSHGDVFAKAENDGSLVVDGEPKNEHAFESDLEFSPVEHPVEPEDEDRPVKCPMPVSSMINDKKMAGERRGTEAVPSKEIIEVAPPPPRPIRVVRKRHHALAGNTSVIKPMMPRTLPNRPSMPSHNCITIYQVLQDFEEFES